MSNSSSLGVFSPLSIIHRNGERLFVTSLEISNRFGKRHDNVVQSIKNLDCSEKYRLLNFKETVYHRPNPSGGAPIAMPMYEITRDGFVFLCMGFTGAQAAIWKERYIEAFNQMESALKETLAAPSASGVPVPVSDVKTVPLEKIFDMVTFAVGPIRREVGKALQALEVERLRRARLHAKYITALEQNQKGYLPVNEERLLHIRACCRAGLSQSEACRQTRCSPSSIRRIYRDEWPEEATAKPFEGVAIENGGAK